MDRRGNIDQVISKLENARPHIRSLAFCDMSKWASADLSGPMTHAGFLALQWWSLLKENTWLVADSFMDFSGKIRTVLEKSKWKSSEIEAHYDSYLMSDAPFRRLAGSCVERAIPIHEIEGAGRLVATVRPSGDDVFLVVSGAQKDYMPVYDFTASGANLGWLMNTYVRLIHAVPGCQVCLVEKRVGPYGPVRHVENLRKLLPGTNIFVYSQKIDGVVPGMGVPKAGAPVVILYDLFATGKGLNDDVAKPLLLQYADVLAGTPIYACVIHVFDEDCPGENTLWTSRLCSYNAFVDGGASASKNVPLADPNDSDENANFLSRVIYLNKGSLSDFEDKTPSKFSSNEARDLEIPASVFHHRQREDIYQVAESV